MKVVIPFQIERVGDDFILNDKPLMSFENVNTMIEKDHFNNIRNCGIPSLDSTQEVPQELSEKNLYDRVVKCTYMLARNKNEPFLNRTITGDGKWITYENIVRKITYCESGKLDTSTFKPSCSQNKMSVMMGSPKTNILGAFVT